MKILKMPARKIIRIPGKAARKIIARILGKAARAAVRIAVRKTARLTAGKGICRQDQERFWNRSREEVTGLWEHIQ